MKDLIIARFLDGRLQLFGREVGNIQFSFIRDLTGVKLPRDIEERICMLKLLGDGTIEGVGSRCVDSKPKDTYSDATILYNIPDDHEILKRNLNAQTIRTIP